MKKKNENGIEDGLCLRFCLPLFIHGGVPTLAREVSRGLSCMRR